MRLFPLGYVGIARTAAQSSTVQGRQGPRRPQKPCPSEEGRRCEKGGSCEEGFRQKQGRARKKDGLAQASGCAARWQANAVQGGLCATSDAHQTQGLTHAGCGRAPHALVRKAVDDLKAKDIQEIDVRGKSSVTDLLVVVSGTSSRHVKSIADEVVKQAKHAKMPPLGVEGHREGEWVLVDLGDIIVHVMLPRTREFYALERLWTVGDDVPSTLAG